MAHAQEQALSGRDRSDKANSGAVRRIAIVTGGRLGEWALNEIKPEDWLIGADRGALFLIQKGLTPDLAVGDFDSVTPEERELIRSRSRSFEEVDPIRKDDSDTELAFHRALERNPAEVLLLGGLGTRFDHSLANVHLLANAADLGIPMRLIDEHNDIRLATPGSTAVIAQSRFPYASLLPLTAEVTGITLTGFQYPLSDAILLLGRTLGISNRLVDAKGTIRIQSGRLLVIQSAD